LQKNSEARFRTKTNRKNQKPIAKIGTKSPVLPASEFVSAKKQQVVFYAAKNAFCGIKPTCPRPEVGG
jgi:hypothetical protein